VLMVNTKVKLANGVGEILYEAAGGPIAYYRLAIEIEA
jgi:hypothetical protein